MHIGKEGDEKDKLVKSYGGAQKWMQYDSSVYSNKGCGLIANTNVALHWLRKHDKNNINFGDKQAVQRGYARG